MGIGNPSTNRTGRALANKVVKLGAIDCGHDSMMEELAEPIRYNRAAEG